MKEKYIVKSETQRELYLVRLDEGDSDHSYAFRPCPYGYEMEEFETKEEAISACENATKHDGGNYKPIIITTIVK